VGSVSPERKIEILLIVLQDISDILVLNKAQFTAMDKRKEIIESKLKEVGKARIVIKDKMLPGCLIKIGDRHISVQKEIIGPKTAMLVNEEIKFI